MGSRTAANRPRVPRPRQIRRKSYRERFLHPKRKAIKLSCTESVFHPRPRIVAARRRRSLRRGGLIEMRLPRPHFVLPRNDNRDQSASLGYDSGAAPVKRHIAASTAPSKTERTIGDKFIMSRRIPSFGDIHGTWQQVPRPRQIRQQSYRERFSPVSPTVFG